MDRRAFPPVSVVIVSWNAREYLRQCLQSLGNEAYAGVLEVIVVDNASEDGSDELVRTHFPEVKLICNKENFGFSKANNIGIAHSTSDYIALINSDVCVIRNCLSILVNYSQSHPLAGLVGPYILGPDGQQQVSYRAAPNLLSELCRALALDSLFSQFAHSRGEAVDRESYRYPVTVDILSGCFWLTTRRAINDVGLLDESFFIYAEDMDWCKRFKDSGWGVDFVPEAVAIHHGGASSANAPVRFSVEMQKAITHYWRKHHSLPALAVYCVIAFLHHALRFVGHFLRGCLPGGNGQLSWRKARSSLACVMWLVARG